MIDDEPKEFSKSELNLIVENIFNSLTNRFLSEIKIKDKHIALLNKLLINANSPPKIGRPKNTPSFSKMLLNAVKEKNPLGRPKKYEDRLEEITFWDCNRKSKSQELGLPPISDKKYIKILIQEAHPNWSNWKREEKENELKSAIKSLRDMTKIRTRTRKK